MILLMTKLGLPHLYVSDSGYLCWSYRWHRVWRSGVLINHKLPSR